MEILAFVDGSQVDPIYFDFSYLAVPEAAGAKAYRLLTKALEDTSRMGVAKLTMHQREYTVFVRPRQQGLTLHTMFYSNEITNVAEYGRHDEARLNPQELKLAEQLVETLAADFNSKQYRDEFRERLGALIEARSKGKTVAVAPQAAPAHVIDIMQALKKSLAATGAKQEARPEVGRPVAATAGRRQRRKAG